MDTGALAKIRVESNGLTSLHYETLFQPKNKVHSVPAVPALTPQPPCTAVCMQDAPSVLTLAAVQVGLSAQLDAKDLNKAPKLGGFIDVSHS